MGSCAEHRKSIIGAGAMMKPSAPDRCRVTCLCDTSVFALNVDAQEIVVN